MDKMKLVKILGVIVTTVGAAATLISDWVDDQKMEAAVEELVNKKFAEMMETENEDEEP